MKVKLLREWSSQQALYGMLTELSGETITDKDVAATLPKAIDDETPEAIRNAAEAKGANTVITLSAVPDSTVAKGPEQARAYTRITIANFLTHFDITLPEISKFVPPEPEEGEEPPTEDELKELERTYYFNHLKGGLESPIEPEDLEITWHDLGVTFDFTNHYGICDSIYTNFFVPDTRKDIAVLFPDQVLDAFEV